MIIITLTETDYFLPEDGDVAQQRFLELLKQPRQVYLSGYGFTLQPMFDELAAADDDGATIDLLLDHSQASGRAAKPKIKALAESFLKNGRSTITITTAGVNSAKRDQIWHWKGFAALGQDAEDYDCWEGSTNFTQSAWFQGNSCRVFQSPEWTNLFIKQFLEHKAWARKNEPHYQIM
jgi:hypothetical protein